MKNMAVEGGGIYLLSRALGGWINVFFFWTVNREICPEAATSLKSPGRAKGDTRTIQPPGGKKNKKKTGQSKQTNKQTKGCRGDLDLAGVLDVVDEVEGLLDGLPQGQDAVVPQHQHLKGSRRQPPTPSPTPSPTFADP